MTDKELKALVMAQVVSGLLSNNALVDGDINWGPLIADAAEAARLILQQVGDK
jgi:hypothetical protein